MTSQERLLYQQIHPAKLVTDFGSSFASAWLLWQAHYVPAIIVGHLVAGAKEEAARAVLAYLRSHGWQPAARAGRR